MSRRKTSVRTTKLQRFRLKGKRQGAILQEQTTLEDGKVVAYSLTYINPRKCLVDNGRVLGYDNAHGFHHRHFMGRIEPVSFSSYEILAERFFNEVHQIWRIEDEEE